MSYTTTTLSTTAKHIIRYRFTCECCGQTTGWYDIELVRRVETAW